MGDLLARQQDFPEFQFEAPLARDVDKDPQSAMLTVRFVEIDAPAEEIPVDELRS